MASPDVSKYVDLTIFDLQPADIYDAAVEYASTALPEWTPVPGSIEDAMLQGASSMTGQLIGAINRLPSGLMEGLLKLYGIDRETGTAPTGTVLVTFTNYNGNTIPAGTRIGYTDNSNADPVLYVFETTETVTVGLGTNTANIPIRGVAFERYPLLVSGEKLQLLSAFSYVDEISLVGNLEIGSDPETDEEFFNRATQVLGRLSEAIALPSQMDSYALTNYATVYRAKAYSRVRSDLDLTALSRLDNVVTGTLSASAVSASAIFEIGDPVRLIDADESFNGFFSISGMDGLDVYWSQTGASATASAAGTLISQGLQSLFVDEFTNEYIPQNGYVTIYGSAVGGASLTAETLDSIQNDLTDKSVAGLIIHSDNARVANLNVAIDVVKDRVVPASTVEAAILEALDGYIHPDYWPWDEVVYVNEIIALVDGVSGVSRVVDVALTSDNPLITIDVDGNAVFSYYGVLPFHVTSVTIEN